MRVMPPSLFDAACGQSRQRAPEDKRCLPKSGDAHVLRVFQRHSIRVESITLPSARHGLGP